MGRAGSLPATSSSASHLSWGPGADCQGKNPSKRLGLGSDTSKNRCCRRASSHAAPLCVSVQSCEPRTSCPRAESSPPYKGTPRAPQDRGCPRQEGRLIRPRGSPGQLQPLPPWVPITWGCFPSNAAQCSLPPLPQQGRSRENHEHTCTRRHTPEPTRDLLGCCSPHPGKGRCPVPG